MYTIELNRKELQYLLEKGEYMLSKNEMISIEDKCICYNKNGFLELPTSTILNFEKSEIENYDKIRFIQKLICDHLNLSPCEVIHIYSCEDTVFKIRFFTDNEIYLIVCDINYARQCSVELEFNINEINTKQIGPYHQLGSSGYYFRWSHTI